MTERLERCELCRYWDRLEERGECRRHAPRFLAALVPGLDAEDPLAGMWPETHGDDWCGEWGPLPVTRMAREA